MSPKIHPSIGPLFLFPPKSLISATKSGKDRFFFTAVSKIMSSHSVTVGSKLRGTGDRFGEYLSVYCANFPCLLGGLIQFIGSKFTIHNTQMPKYIVGAD